jgi:flagellar motor switch protein FliG
MSANSALKKLPPPPDARRGFTAPQKAALVIAALGPEAAGPIIERIGDKHLKAFAEAYAHLQKIPRKDLLAVVNEFVAHLGDGGGDDLAGGMEGARELLAHFKGAEGTTKILDDIDAPGGRTVWQKLDAVADNQIARYLERQNPQTAAVILSRLNTDKASSVLGCLEPELAQQVIVRLAKPMAVRREALKVLAEAVEREFLAPARAAAKAKRPGLAIGAMMNNLSAEQRDTFLQFIETQTPDILDDVKSCILTFQDIPKRLPANAAPLVVREMEGDAFLKAAKYGKQNAPETIEFIFKNISQRMKQQYEEQMEGLKQVTVADAEAAQALFMSTVRRLVASGEITLNKVETGEEEQVQYI